MRTRVSTPFRSTIIVEPDGAHTRKQPTRNLLREEVLEGGHVGARTKGLLGQATQYALKHWLRLLEDGRLRLDNNGAENAIRPSTVGRENWLISQSTRGAVASTLLYSLVETWKANGLEPGAYLRHIFEHLPTAGELEDLEARLPWNVTLSMP